MSTLKGTFSANNIFAGFIVAVIALPLCIAFAIASGVDPLAGLVSGVIGGFIAGVGGSSKFQVSGPAAAFITIIFGIVAKDGLAVLLAATFVAGLVVLGIAALRLGRVMELMPHPVIVGFTTGIGVLIVLGQVPGALGMSAEGHNIIGKLTNTFTHLEKADVYELVIVGITLFAGIAYNQTPFKRWVPTPLVVLSVALAVATLIQGLNHPVRTIGSLYTVSLANISVSANFLTEILHHHHAEILLGGLTLGVLIAVESLLSAKALDQMTGSTHDPDRELIGLGLSNVVVPFLGGIPVSGVIVRGSANVMSGATSKFAAVMHSVFLTVFVVFLFGLIKLLPMSGLAALLCLTGWRLMEVHEIQRIMHIDRNEGLLAIATVVLTVTVDLTVSVPLGLVVMILLALKRMIQERTVDVRDLHEKKVFAVRSSVNFLTAPALRTEMEHHLQDPRIEALDLTGVHYMDATGAMMMAEVLKGYPNLAIWVTEHDILNKLHHAGIAADRVRIIGSQLLHLPKLFHELNVPEKPAAKLEL